MISALNRQQLLSGSKLWVLLLCLMMVGACSSQKNTYGPPKGYDVVTDKPAPTKPTKNPKDTILPPIGNIVDTLPKYRHKSFYNVALVLPFYLDSFPTSSGGIFQKSQIAIDYYKGVQMALDTLKANGLSVKMHVFDSHPDSYLDVMIAAGKLKGMDLIIGPVFNSSMKVMAKYALEAGIPVWSPFSPAADITAKNPFFYIANPRMETHARKMIGFVTDSFKQGNLITLYQFTDQEKRYLEIYRNHIADFNKKLNATLADSLQKNPLYKVKPLVLNEKLIGNHGSGLPKISTNELEVLMSHDKQNVVVIPSIKIPFILNVLRELFPLIEKYDIRLVGTSAMGNDVDLQLNYLSGLNVHFTQSYFVKPELYQSDFYQAFIERFKTEPSEYALNGYDQMFFLGTMMKQFGESFRLEMNNVAFEGWATGYSIDPAVLQTTPTDTVPSIDYWDNQHLFMLRYHDYVLERVK